MSDSTDTETGFQAWLKGEPESIQRLAVEFAPGTQFNFDDGAVWLIGYRADDILIVVKVNPRIDFASAMASERLYMCADCVRKAITKH